MDTNSQNKAILRELKRNPLGLTGLEMIQMFGATAYTRRIKDLRESGEPIESLWIYKHDEKGKVVKKWKRYYWVG